MIKIELNGKTRLISIEEFLDRDMQDLLADNLGVEYDPLSDFVPQEEDLPDEIEEDEE